jgi:hypothetical protein
VNILCIESVCPQKNRIIMLLFGIIRRHGRHFDYWNQPLKMHMRIWYLDSWNWTVLLPVDTLRKPIMSITLLLRFGTYLVTLLVVTRIPGVFYCTLPPKCCI